MLSGRLCRDSRLLREAYVEISNYVRHRYRIPASKQYRPLLPTSFTSSRGFTSTLRRRESKKKSKYPTGRDLIEGFPAPGTIVNVGIPGAEEVEPSILAQQVSDVKGNTSSGGKTNGAGHRSYDLSLQNREVLDHYDRRRQLATKTFSWTQLISEFSGQPTPIKLYGFITSRRDVKELTFYTLCSPTLRHAIQITLPRTDAVENVSQVELGGSSAVQMEDEPGTADLAASPDATGSHPQAGKIRPHVPVLVEGHLVARNQETKADDTIIASPGNDNSTSPDSTNPVPSAMEFFRDKFVGALAMCRHVEIRANAITPLNSHPVTAPWAKSGISFPPEQRHLQFRTDAGLRRAIRLRSKALSACRKFMFLKGFDEIETPLLFKSTPEGAREFIVPTRKPGMAYALPQSPQQYKQILMAAGISKYFQFAKCFRDEDMRADRQPEFTQLDMEMSFARAQDVMMTIERLIALTLWPAMALTNPFAEVLQDEKHIRQDNPPDGKLVFPRLTYEDAMSKYGSDKPDLRLGSQIHQIDEWIPVETKKMLSDLDDPIVDILKIDMDDQEVNTSLGFVSEFMDSSSSSEYLSNPAGVPGIAVYDSKKPLNGLASFGHDAAARVEELLSPAPGDIIVVQTRPRAPFVGGSTPLGNLRRDMHYAAIAAGLRPPPEGDSFLWVTDFPLFSPVVDPDAEPGQGGSAGICSTHHPFTAPRADQDLNLLFTDPLKVVGDHYDLVINGVEVGGGSVRVHDSAMQSLIFREVLKMPAHRIKEFQHLLDALASGCPPHAGFALGFDRLMAIAMRRTSVRDVMAFPKFADAEDKMVGSPSKIPAELWKTYNLSVVKHTQGRGGENAHK